MIVGLGKQFWLASSRCAIRTGDRERFALFRHTPTLFGGLTIQHICTSILWIIPLAGILDNIVIHHEGNNQTYDVRHVQRQHMFGDGWWDIGYHFIVGPAGTIYEGRDIGVRGSHAKGANTGKIGVLFLGDFEPGLVHNQQSCFALCSN